MNEERCVCCDAIIPEGRQYCPNCEKNQIIQYDIFGNDFQYNELMIQYIDSQKKSRKIKTMQEMNGTITGKICRDCKHCYAKRMSRTWYKCELWDVFFRGSSEASDIRLKNQACGKYEEAEITID